MNPKNNPADQANGFKLTVSRVINAPCEMVFRAWTDAKQMVQWFSPEQVECRSVTADLRIGGVYRIHMVSEKGDHVTVGEYREIIPNRRLQFTWQWENYAMPDSVVTVEFENLGKTTRLTLTHEGCPDQEDTADHNRGWTSAIEKFARMIEQNEIKP